MCRLLEQMWIYHVKLSVKDLLSLHLIFFGVLVTVVGTQRSHPNECSDDPVNPCCPGWQISPTSGLCLIAVCEEGCGEGYCIGANVCRCPDGALARNCKTGRDASSGQARLPPEYKYDKSVAREAEFEDDSSRELSTQDICEHLRCQQRCDVRNGVAQCGCDAGYRLDTNGVTCNDIDECYQYAHICSHGCHNTLGGFVCDCRSGYTLHSDGRTCTPVRVSKTDRPSSVEDSSEDSEEWRRYIGDMLDPKKPTTVEADQDEAHPQIGIQARVRTTQRRRPQSHKPQTPTSAGHPMSPHYGQPNNPTSGKEIGKQGYDPYSLPSELDPNAKYEQLPPDLTKQIFGKYDRKKLVPFDFEDREYVEPKFVDPNSRAIFWEELPTDIATTYGPCPDGGFDCPELLHENHKPALPPPELPKEPRTVASARQPLSDIGKIKKPQIKAFKVGTRKTSGRHQKGKQPTPRRKPRKQRGKTHFRKNEKPKTTVLPQNSKNMSSSVNSSESSDTEQPQKDGKACRGDLCFSTDDLEDPSVTPLGQIQTDAFGRCPKGYEAVVVNDFEVCKPLPKTEQPRRPNTPPTSTVGPPKHSYVTGEGDISVDTFSNRNSSLVTAKPTKPTLPPFINFCVKEGKIMIITVKGIHCRDKAEESLFVDCAEQEVYVETVAGYICRDPSTEDILSKPIQCPAGHTLIKTNTGYECRGTVTLESLCPSNYERVQTMSGTICSPSAPLTAVGDSSCPPGEMLSETEGGMKCIVVTDELAAATVVSNEHDASFTGTTEDPVGLPPRPEIFPTSSTPVMTTVAMKCPPGQIGVQTENGPVCKYFSRLQKGRGDLQPSCPNGMTRMETQSGPICIGASVLIEYEQPKTVHIIQPTGIPLSPDQCPEGQIIVNTNGVEECEDIERPLVLPTDDVLHVENVCPDGQIAVNTTQGSECRWIGLEKETDSTVFCPDRQSMRQTNFGLLCIDDSSGEPSVDTSLHCPRGQLGLFTPKGSICKGEGVIVGKILTITDIDDLATQPGCGLENVVFQTLAGPLCLDKLTREPVLDENEVCGDSDVAVLTPDGVVCKLRSDILLYTLSGETCNIGQTTATTEAGTICVYKESQQPVIDKSMSCPDGQAPVVTPSGTFCKLSSVILISLFEKTVIEECQTGQTILETAAGAICIDRESLLPVTDHSMLCPDGNVPVVTPSGTFCKLLSDILTGVPETEEITCPQGHPVETELGLICFATSTLQPIIDETASCPDGKVPIVTPSGTKCKPQAGILTRLIKKPKNEVGVSTDISSLSCHEGQRILDTEAGIICVHSESLQPVVDESIFCANGHSAVVTPTGTFCKLRTAILSRFLVDEENACGIHIALETEVGPICIHNETYHPIIDANVPCPDGKVPLETPSGTLCKLRSAIVHIFTDLKELSCADGQTSFETDVGTICVYNNTLQPVIDDSVICSDGETPMVTPTGTVCKLRSAILTSITDMKELPCANGQKSFETEVGIICIHDNTLQPVIDESVICADGEAPIVTPTGTLCKLQSALLTSLTVIKKHFCADGQKVLETEVGIICIHEKTLQPVIDESVKCSVGEAPIVTPTGTLCKLRSAILTSLTDTKELSCAHGQKSYETEVGIICIDEKTLQPVIDESVICADGEAPIVTPTGTLCKLRSAIMTSLTVIKKSFCAVGQKVLETEVGTICIHEKTLQPVIDESVFCSDGKLPVVTPTGTLCKLRSGILISISETEETKCADGQKIWKIASWSICLHGKTMQPIIDKSVHCPDKAAPVVTPNGTLCKVLSLILSCLAEKLKCLNGEGVMKAKFGYVCHDATLPLLTAGTDCKSILVANFTSQEEPKCAGEWTAWETEEGVICIDNKTLQPIIDETNSCPDGESSVLTPNSTICLPDYVITTLVKKLNESGQSSIDTGASCGADKVAHSTDGGIICIFNDTKQPVIDTTMFCPEGQAAVVSPSGTFCMLRSVIYAKLKKVSRKMITTSSTTPMPESCESDQTVLQTEVGPICIYEETLKPVIAEDLACRDGLLPVVAPSGTFCLLRAKLFAALSKIPSQKNITTSPRPTSHCQEGQITIETDVGEICINAETSQLIIDNNVSCPHSEIPVVTPSGTLCKLHSALITRLSKKPSAKNEILISSSYQKKCGNGQKVLDTDFGPICISEDTNQPVVDDSSICKRSQKAIVTPNGPICFPDIAKFVDRDINDTTAGVTESHCGEGQKLHQLKSLIICVYEKTSEPVIDMGVSCSRSKLAVRTPAGFVCKSKRVIYGRQKKFGKENGKTTLESVESSGNESCLPGQHKLQENGVWVCKDESNFEELEVETSCGPARKIYQTEDGLICLDEETLEPIFDETITCPNSKVPYVTPLGTVCKLRPRETDMVRAKEDRGREDISHKECGIGQEVRTTDTGLICIHKDSRQPIIVEAMFCPPGTFAVKTPSGLSCRSPELICPPGEMLDLLVTGYYCVPITVEFSTTLAATQSSTDKLDITTSEDRLTKTECGDGQGVHPTNVGFICVYENSHQPVINVTVFCPPGKIAVKTPSGFSCVLQELICPPGEQLQFQTDGYNCVAITDTPSTIQPPLSLETTLTPTTGANESVSEEDKPEKDFTSGNCGVGQQVHSTTSGLICVYEHSNQPVIDESVFCPPGKLAVKTPSGFSCRLRGRICPAGKEITESSTGYHCVYSTPQAQTSTLTPQTTTAKRPSCADGHLTDETVLGPICIDSYTLEPVIDKALACPENKVAIKTPTSSVCLLRSTVFKEDEPPAPRPVTAPSIRMPVCPQGQHPVLRNGKYVCRHVIVSKEEVQRATPEPERSLESCQVGQRIYLTSVGKICIYERSLQPVTHIGVACPQNQLAVMTPAGLACKDVASIRQSLPDSTNPPEETASTRPDEDRGCPEGQTTVSEDGQLVCKPESEVDTTEECPPGYIKVMAEGQSEYGCRYVGFGTKKSRSRGPDTETPPPQKCPFGLVLIQTHRGPACTYPQFARTTTAPGPREGRFPGGGNFRPPIITGQPCSPGSNCGDGNPKQHGETYPCQGGVNCGGIQPVIPRPVSPCLNGMNCGIPIVRAPIVRSGCINGILIASGQPCGAPISYPHGQGHIPCSGSNCGAPVMPCQNGNCGSPAVPSSYSGCINGVTHAGGCGMQPRPSYPFTVTQSCSNGFQPFQRGKVYMCLPMKFRGMCQNNIMLQRLLGQDRCNGFQQAVPPRRSITPCTLSGHYKITGKLSSACSPMNGLQPVEGSEGVCRDGEQLFQSPKGRTVCLPVTAVTSRPVQQVQQEALPSCAATERLVKTDRGYICQARSATDCDPACANGGKCLNGVCRCKRGLTGTSCQTDIDECKRLPERYCHYKCVNEFGSFKCVCPTGYNLNADKRTCKAVGCTPDCRNGGTCVRGECSCPPGYTGKQCETDINECETSSGLCEYQCMNTMGGYTCSCPQGSQLKEDGKSCESRDCMLSCQNGATCKGHRCFCAPGYFGVSCQLDINECYHFRPCSHLCHNTKGSYVCACRPGYRLASDGHMCLRASPPVDSSGRRRLPGLSGGRRRPPRS